MNFLSLVQRLAVECGVYATQDIATKIPSIGSASGSSGRLVNWVNDALSDILSAHDDWDFMRSSNLLGAGVSFPTIAGQATYKLGTNTGEVGIDPDTFGKWDRGTFRNYTTSVGFRDEIPMDDIRYDRWRNEYMMNANRLVQTRPIAVAIGPDKSLCLGPPSNGLYTITGDYFLAPVAMVADADIPLGLPTRFHMMIVYSGMCKYAGYDAASEVFQRGSDEYGRMYAQLQALYAPAISFGAALA